MSKKFEIVRPNSLTDSAYEDYEYLLRWIGRDGSDYQLMFYDAEIKRRIDSEEINTEDSDLIRSLISKVGESVAITAADLSLSDLSIVLQIIENPVIRRIKKDDTEERYATEGRSFSYRLKDGRYQVEFTLIKADTKTWR